MKQYIINYNRSNEYRFMLFRFSKALEQLGKQHANYGMSRASHLVTQMSFYP